jgi:hypothetical protein
MAVAVEDHVSCCYALQDKVWVDDPDGAPWEIYTVLADVEAPAGSADPCGPGACCSSSAAAEATDGGDQPASAITA